MVCSADCCVSNFESSERSMLSSEMEYRKSVVLAVGLFLALAMIWSKRFYTNLDGVPGLLMSSGTREL